MRDSNKLTRWGLVTLMLGSVVGFCIVAVAGVIYIVPEFGLLGLAWLLGAAGIALANLVFVVLRQRKR